MSQPSLGRSSTIMAIGSLASRVLGLVRGSLITAIVGTLAVADAFELANTLPNVFYMLAAGGVINAVLIPSLARAMKLEDGGQDFTDRIVTIAVTLMLVLTVLLTALSPFIVRALSGGRGGGFESLATAFALMCIPQVFFYGLYALLGQILNSRGRFGAFAWAPAVMNIVSILLFGLFLLIYPSAVSRGPDGRPHQRMPDEWTPEMVWLFAGAATVAVAAQALMLIPALRGSGFRYRPRWGVRGAGLRGASRLALWAFVGLALSQLGFFINQWFLNSAAEAGAGAHPVYGYGVYSIAFLIFMLPHGFVTVSIITALYPQLAGHAAGADLLALKAGFRRGLSLCLVALVPATTLVLATGQALVGFLRPTADGPAIEITSLVLGVMILGLVPFGLDLLCYRTLFALEDGRSTAYMALTGLGVLVAVVSLSRLAAPQYTIGIVAAGQTLSNAASSSVGVLRIRRQIGSLGLGPVMVTVSRLGVAAVVAGLLAWAATSALRPLMDSGRGVEVWARMLSGGLVLAVASGLFAAVYLRLTHLMKVAEVHELVGMVRTRLGR